MGEIHANVVFLLAIMVYLFGSVAISYLMDFGEKEVLMYGGVAMYVLVLLSALV